MWGHMSTTDLPGSSLLAGRYRLVERLGAGGMSVVWRGFDEVLGRQVAVKVLPPSTSGDPAFRRRLRAEAQAAARLSHPQITNVYDYGEATTVDGEPVPYVVMELIDGESLAAVLARVRRLPWQHAVRITAEVAAALAAAHSRGIVHRDVTPANVMLTPAGAKVVDFGISALIGENDIDPDGSLLGTPAYLAPERLEGGQVSPATDVYAVGLLIYRILIGQLPWDVGTTTALLRAHQYTEPDPLPPVEGMPAAVAALVGRCLEKQPSDRPSSAELAHVLAGISAAAPAVGRGYVPDWSASGEDTTILPDPRSYPEMIRSEPTFPVPAGTAHSSVNAAEPAPEAPAHNSRFPALRSHPVSSAAVASASPAPAQREPAQRESAQRESAQSVSAQSLPAQQVSGPPAPAGQAVRPPFRKQPAVSAVPLGSPSRDSGDVDGPGRARPHTRRVMVIAGTVVVLGLATYGWSLANGTGGAPTSIPQPSVVPASGKCVVSYAVWSDANGAFSARVTVANRDDTAIKDWKLWFILPGDQVVSGNGKVRLSQQGSSVTMTSTAALGSQMALTMPITGRYRENNSAPLAFMLNNNTCETFVSAKPGEPSRQVEHLSDGNVRLAPTTSTPPPGISIGPGGIVHITPTTAPASSAATSAATTPATGPTTTIPPAPPTDDPAAPPTTTPTAGATTTTPVVPPTSPSLEACDPADTTCENSSSG